MSAAPPPASDPEDAEGTTATAVSASGCEEAEEPHREEAETAEARSTPQAAAEAPVAPAAGRSLRIIERLAEFQRAAAGPAQEVLLRNAAAEGADAAEQAVAPEREEAAAAPGSAPQAPAEDLERGEEDDGPVCWICRDPDLPEPLIVPCECRGSLRGVHASCMEAWLLQRQRHRFQAPDQNPMMLDTRCDLCRAPMRVVYQPAGRNAFMRAHVAQCWRSCWREVLPVVLVTLASYIWLGGTMLLYLLPMSMIADKVVDGDRSSTTLLAICVGVSYLGLCVELLAVLISYPWSSPRPRNRLLARLYMGELQRRPMVVVLWAHLYTMAVMALVICVGIKDEARRLRFALLVPVLIPPLCPHVKALIVGWRSGAMPRWRLRWQGWQHLRRSFVDGWRSCRQHCCNPHCRFVCYMLAKLFGNPVFPWFHALVGLVIGSYTAIVTDTKLRPWSLMSCAVPCILAALAAVVAGGVIARRGPLHPSFRFGAVHVHFAWWLVLFVQCYSLAPAVFFTKLELKAKRESHLVEYEVLAGAVASWMTLISVLALYTNITACRAYCIRWQAAHGEARLEGTPLVGAAGGAGGSATEES